MRLKRDVALELMRLADGELDADSASHARALAERDPTLLASVRDPRVAAWLRTSMGERASDAAADGIVDDVMARLPDSSAARVRAARRRRLDFSWVQASAALALAAGISMYLAVNRTPHPVSQTAPVGALVESSALGGGVELHEIDALSEVSVFEIAGARRTAAGKVPPSSLVIWIEDEPDEPETEKGP